MIRHCVMLYLNSDYDVTSLQTVMRGLGEIAERLPGCGNFVHGANRDFEAKSPDYPYGFTMDFSSEADLHRYAEDADHRALGTALVDMCVGGGDGILVFDLEFSASEAS